MAKSRDKPKKTDPFPNASRKIKMTGYDCYTSSRWGEYRVYPDGKIDIGNPERLRLLSDQRVAAKQLFDFAAAHVQEVEEKIAKSMRDFWDNFRKDRGSDTDEWSINMVTGELSRIEPNNIAPESTSQPDTDDG